ncbi:MAG: M23 family metallopeptidase, partial [Candidatus Dojkabacteria bacterium]|nr:M23 family metallopeptidase [Candidatus Dojkabacteria bacterium]
ELIKAKDYWPYRNTDEYVTNKVEVQISLEAERLSDVIIVQNSLNNEPIRGKADKIGYYLSKISLGKKTGSKEDGWYTFLLVSADSAGNKSSTRNLKILRDTIAPEFKSVSDPYYCGENICVKVEGEPGTYLFSGSIFITKLGSGIREIELTHEWEYETYYQYEFYLEDEARNRSKRILRWFKTPEAGKGDVEGTSDENPWGYKKGSDLPPVTFDVKINSDKSFFISNLKIPSPRLTRTVNEGSNEISVYGYAVPKSHKLIANITKEFNTFNEATTICNAGFLLNDSDKKCMAEAMGIENLNQWIWEMQTDCVFSPICFNSRKSYLRNTERYEKFLPTEHVMVSLFKEASDLPNISNLWNDNPEGRFRYRIKLNDDIKIGDYVKAKTVIFGDFESNGTLINYRGLNQNDSMKNEGLKSHFSNSLKIPKSPFAFSNAVSPVSDSSCEGYLVSSLFGYRKDPFTGEDKFHGGVDIAKAGGCKIVAVQDGEASIGWYAGNTVYISHNSRFETRYGHAEYYLGEYPREVDRAERIMYMGASGKATGVHIHFEVWDKGTVVDPQKYFKL